MLLLIDNYDSFTYNLVQYFQICKIHVEVVRNDAPIPSQTPDYLVISPGPGFPTQSGNSKRLINQFHGKIPILGVCLGHQCIGELFGGRILHAKAPMHGKTSEIFHDGRGVFKNMQQNFLAARYHSLVVDKNSLPESLEVSATTRDGEIMGLRHRDYPTEGVQFHPESIATENGLQIIQNFLNLGEKHVKTNNSFHCNPLHSLPSSRTNALHHQTGCSC